MAYKIYKLVDPDTELVRYVGRTTKPLEHRLSAHISCRTNNKKPCKKNQWLRSIDDLENRKVIFLIEEVFDEKEASQRETYWTQYYKDLLQADFNIKIGDTVPKGHKQKLDIIKRKTKDKELKKFQKLQKEKEQLDLDIKKEEALKNKPVLDLLEQILSLKAEINSIKKERGLNSDDPGPDYNEHYLVEVLLGCNYKSKICKPVKYTGIKYSKKIKFKPNVITEYR